MKDPVYTFRNIIEPDGKGYHGFVPLLPGVHIYGKNLKEAKKRLDEATRCHLQGLFKDKLMVPQESETLETITTFSVGDLRLAGRHA